MIFQHINATDAEKVFARGINETGSTISAGELVCLHVRTIASADGIRVESPVTSALPGFFGIADEDIVSAASSNFAVQVYGFTNKAFLSGEAGDTHAPGQVVGPLNAQNYANSSGHSTNLGPLIIMSQRAGALLEANPMFIRAM